MVPTVVQLAKERGCGIRLEKLKEYGREPKRPIRHFAIP
jgi:hypothetical protein